VDTYEASVWQVPPSNTALVTKVQTGTVTLADLTGGGATQLGPSSSCTPGWPANFPRGGNWTAVLGSNPPSPGVYAVSIPGVHPTTCIDWFQAAQACALSGKRLLRNEEWQRAASGTPDPGTDNGTTDCNITTVGAAVNTGSRSNCKSNWGAFDMVGNVDEWVADWVPLFNDRPGWGPFSDDRMCLSGAINAANGPGALLRGGNFVDGTAAGVFAVLEQFPQGSDSGDGFRCAR
jgi:formylglycine-generating enzyme required for sulfatase activity